MLLDVIVIDDCNGFLFLRGRKSEVGQQGIGIFPFPRNNDRDSTVKSSSPFALFYLFIYVSNVYI